MSEAYTTRDVEFTGSRGDAGDTYEVTCPVCKQIVSYAEHQWWNPVCRCGVRWSVDVVATGVKE